jgi:hypothetical protein
VAERLSDAERQALGWLRDDGHDRFRLAHRRVRDGLVQRGLVVLIGSRFGTHYELTLRGLEALEAQPL